MERERGLIGDFFCGAGGASVGIEEAFGRSVDFAVNHDQTAIKLHSRNHPGTYHMTEDIFTSDVEKFVQGRKVSLLWASPDCTHFSRAKGKTPRKAGIRMLPYAVYFHAAQVRPEVICMENVAEIQNWGPVEDREDHPGYGQPVKGLEGCCYNCFVAHMSQGNLETDGRLSGTPAECKHFCDQCQVVTEHYTKNLGYQFECRELCAADYGAPTTRKRWYAIIRSDGRPICWPSPTNSKNGENGLKPWIPASSILDLDDYGLSIFDRKKSLAKNTQKRIAMGIKKYVLNGEEPFIIHVNHSGDGFRGQSVKEPLPTMTRKLGMGLVSVKTMKMEQFLTKFYKSGIGQSVEKPLHTVTTSPGHFGLVSVHTSPKENLDKLEKKQLQRAQQVSQFLMLYYGSDIGQSIEKPLRTIVTKDRFSLITVQHSGRVIMDIHMRMLSANELKRGNGFPDDYDIAHDSRWHKVPIHEQTAKIGNAVVPAMAKAIVSANCPYLYEGERVPFVQIQIPVNGQLAFS